jgi:CBS domain-containing protein
VKNTIAERIYDFLKDFPPFNVLSKEQLFTISKNVKVIYVENETYVFKQEEKPHDSFYVVKDGAVGIFREHDAFLVDECDEGDIFGLRALIGKNNYLLSAKAIEESIIYSISANLLEEIITTNSEANKFLLASFATNTRNPYSNEEKGTLFANDESLQISKNNLTEVQSAQYSKNPVTCDAKTTIIEAANTMTSKRVGSIIITKNNKPTGIITDKDLRTKIATGIFSIQDTVDKIMSSPVITYAEHITVAEAQIAMLQHKITHLCITKDGTPNSDLKGILSEHDIVVIHGNNPSVLIKEVKRAKSAENLKYIRDKAENLLAGYLEQNVPIFFISKIITAINDAITKKSIEISLQEMEQEPPTTFGWLAIGSQGRKEQLLLTDQDNALVYEDVSNEKQPEVQKYFLELSKKVTEKLHIIGFEFCPADMMASNPKWCLSLSEWKKQFRNWITKPDENKIMLCTIFFDYDLIYGNKKLVDEMSESIFQSIDTYEIFLNFLALNAVKNPPPLSFFRQFLVEHGGEHKDQFDIKARALMPLVDAARLLVLSKNVKDFNNTIFRFEKLAHLEPQNKDLYESCISAFKILLRFRTQQGLKNKDSGRFIDLSLLSKGDKLKLKSCFKPIKDIQELISIRFKLAQLL